MKSTPIPVQLIQTDDLQKINKRFDTIIDLLKQKTDEQFKLRWIESKKIPALLGISSRTWQSWRDKKIIPFSQFGAKIYVKLEDVNKLLESHMVHLKAV